MEIPSEKKIYCNRTVNLESISAIGFDMDYTLAIYRPETFEQLSYQETLKKLVDMGYPKEILMWSLDWNSMIRGLAMDTLKGNIIKMDRHRYVKMAFHGFTQYTKEQRKTEYNTYPVLGYNDNDLVFMDTAFTLTEAYLYTQLVEYSKNHNLNKTFQEIHWDVRYAFDYSHDIGDLKKIVVQNPENFIQWDPFLLQTLVDIKLSGRKLFIVTNSRWSYAQVILEYLLQDCERVTQKPWTDIFDFVITHAQKPAFFQKESHLIKLHPNVYEGGYYKDVHSLLGIQSASQILYVGDHIYGDILRSKKQLGWRTLFIIPELEKEIEIAHSLHYETAAYLQSHELKNYVDTELQECLQNHFHSDDDEVQKKIAFLKEQKSHLHLNLLEQLAHRHTQFHPVWGEIMKTGNQNSLLASQMENYACLYTSYVSNLRFYLPHKTFTAQGDNLPHDLP